MNKGEFQYNAIAVPHSGRRHHAAKVEDGEIVEIACHNAMAEISRHKPLAVRTGEENRFRMCRNCQNRLDEIPGVRTTFSAVVVEDVETYRNSASRGSDNTPREVRAD